MSAAPLTAEELQYVFNHGYSIRCKWIGPVEGYEYTVYRIGQVQATLDTNGASAMCYRKSERACYNFIRRQVEASANEPKAKGKR